MQQDKKKKAFFFFWFCFSSCRFKADVSIWAPLAHPVCARVPTARWHLAVRRHTQICFERLSGGWVFEMQRYPCGFGSSSLSADSQQEVNLNCSRGWHQLSQHTDVHHYSAAAQADNLFHKWAGIANARTTPSLRTHNEPAWIVNGF